MARQFMTNWSVNMLLRINGRYLILSSLFSTIFLSPLTTAVASNNQYDWGEGLINFSDSTLVNNQQGEHNHWRAIARVSVSGGMTCTGTFIDTGSDNGPAYVLTNGHCTGVWNENEFQVNKKVSGSVTFNYFIDTKEQQQAYSAKTIKWATMRGHDLAVIELNATVGELKQAGITPMKLATKVLPENNDILIIGAPTDGVPYDQSYMRIAACIQESTHNVIEAHWNWFSAQRNKCHDIKGGSSGSPVINRYTNEVVGVLNTTTAGSSDYAVCFSGAPCELTENGVEKQKGSNYAFPVTQLSACFVNGIFDLNASSCTLDKGNGVTLDYQYGDAKSEVDDQGIAHYPNWEASVKGHDYYRYKVTSSHAACQDIYNYSGVVATELQPVIQDTLGTQEGYRFLCVIGGSTPEYSEHWQSPQHATIAHKKLDSTPPTVRPPLHIESGEDSVFAQLGYLPPEISLFKVKQGQPDKTDCNNMEGYRIPFWTNFFFKREELPQVLCVIAADQAGNESAPWKFDIK